MSKYTKIYKRNNEQFKRLTGVSKETFDQMVKLLKDNEAHRKKVSGRPLRLCYEDQTLMMLEYLREYRTYYHIATDYGMSESNAYRVIRRVEDILVTSKAFRLPAKNRIMSDMNLEVILIDATESPCERPKKSSKSTTPAKRSVIR